MAKPKTIEESFASAIPLPVYRKITRRNVISFVYHQISPSPVDYVKHIYPSKTPEEFEQDLLYINEHFNPVSYDQLLGYYEGSENLPPRAIFISFDDGYRECHTIVAPLLSKHRVPCTFFLTTGYLDNTALYYRNKYSLCVDLILNQSSIEVQDLLDDVKRRFDRSFEDRDGLLAWLRSLRISEESILAEFCDLLGVDVQGLLKARTPYLTRNQVEGLIEEGFTIGAHSVRHPKFLDLELDAVREEIITSCETIASLTRKQKIPFAFPFSGVGVERGWLRDLKQENPVIGLYFETLGIRKDAPFVVNRIWADPPADPPQATSNLDTLLHEAYQANAVWRRRYYASMAAYRLGFNRD